MDHGPNPPDPDVPPQWQRAVSAPFVVNERYGTRCTTVVFIGHDGRAAVHELRFDPAGVQTGASRIEFRVVPAREMQGTPGSPHTAGEAIAADICAE